MRLRTRFLAGFILVIAAALAATQATYTVVYTLRLDDRFVTTPDDSRRLMIVMVLVVPSFWFLVSMVAGAWWMGRSVARPFAELGRAVQHLQRKDLDFMITYDGRDELGDLCRAVRTLQQELRASLDREWREQESRREMTAAVAHDLRTPLTVMRSHAEGLLAATPERRAQRMDRYLQAIAASARRAGLLLDDLLTFTRLERADLPLRLEPVCLTDLLAGWASDYATLAALQGVTLRWEPAGSPSDLVLADPVRLHQVMDNLVENGLRHAPAGGEVGIRLRWSPKTAEVAVWDTGPGFAAADLPHLFDIHFQGGGAVGAAGLGLHICRVLVARHGGRIEAANRAEGGSQVSFSLPRAPVVVGADVGGTSATERMKAGG
jgi:signal transduction histidine kinase